MTSNSDNNSNSDNDRIEDLMAAYSTKTTTNIYGRLVRDRPFIDLSKREAFRRYSLTWYNLLGFNTPILGIKALRKRKANSEIGLEINRIREARINALGSINLERELRYLYDNSTDSIKFRGLQKVTLEAIIAYKTPIITIFGTGVGKSLLFLLPAYSSRGGVIIVIEPLIALIEDLNERCKSIGISSTIWNNSRPYVTSNIVFAIPEIVAIDPFKAVLADLAYSKRLDRIVFDKCDLILEGNDRFRPELSRLGELNIYGIQSIYLTATLPPFKERLFLEKTYIEDSNKPLIFRIPTSKPNIRYSVKSLYYSRK